MWAVWSGPSDAGSVPWSPSLSPTTPSSAVWSARPDTTPISFASSSARLPTGSPLWSVIASLRIGYVARRGGEPHLEASVDHPRLVDVEPGEHRGQRKHAPVRPDCHDQVAPVTRQLHIAGVSQGQREPQVDAVAVASHGHRLACGLGERVVAAVDLRPELHQRGRPRSEEHTSELQSR